MMIYIIYCVQLVNIFFCMIIMLNFLIAVIMESFNNVYSKVQSIKYQQRSHLVLETIHLKSLFKLQEKQTNIVILGIVEKEDDAEDGK